MTRPTRLFAQLSALASVAVLALGTVAAHAVADPGPRGPRVPIRWAVLGDSYTAGAIPATGAQVPLGAPAEDGCLRRQYSYPEILRERLGPLVDLRNASCGGAAIANVAELRQLPIGTHVPQWGLEDPHYPYPPVPLQLDAVSPGTDLVTVGIGGNTLAFVDILGTCYRLGLAGGNTGHPCRDHYTSGLPGEPGIRERLTTVAAEYGRMLDRIHRKAPGARVVSVGYPAIFPESAAASCTWGSAETGDARGLLNFGTITFQDLDWLRHDVLEPLNAVIAEQSAGHRAAFVDLYSSSRGHDVCSTERWVDGILSSPDPNAVALIHPNADGQRNAAAQVETAVLGGFPGWPAWVRPEAGRGTAVAGLTRSSPPSAPPERPGTAPRR
ncbi:SGNH/GDSL hydrolase family protein [Saccharothrix sp. ST-888]|uniref:SGNH/GDSL hydrolase family protein n=1 Tax=Saccharothrix sp. ST-888 TaxID=1427391 RepID=UPI00069833A4|nr:SGNH/GDSL hydrolase family protein [Saccharothrix sp. ST-888]